jgi:hypothetical protein
MLGRSNKRGEPFRFRVSDAVEMPNRGFLLRLRLLDGHAAVGDLSVGSHVRLIAPDGRERVARIFDHSVTAGRQTQERLEQTREFDFVIERADAFIDDEPVAIGWIAAGPVEREGSGR